MLPTVAHLHGLQRQVLRQVPRDQPGIGVVTAARLGGHDVDQALAAEELRGRVAFRRARARGQRHEHH